MERGAKARWRVSGRFLCASLLRYSEGSGGYPEAGRKGDASPSDVFQKMETIEVSNTSVQRADVAKTELGTHPILWTVGICLAATIGGNVVFWVGQATGKIDVLVFWPPIFAIVVTVVALTSFGGFYIASRRARVAIGASFILTFFVVLAFSLTIAALNIAAQNSLAADMVKDFRTVSLTVITFYFGSETLITATKMITARTMDPQARAEMGKLDRDLPILSSHAAPDQAVPAQAVPAQAVPAQAVPAQAAA
jgi:hypothetical protein